MLDSVLEQDSEFEKILDAKVTNDWINISLFNLRAMTVRLIAKVDDLKKEINIKNSELGNKIDQISFALKVNDNQPISSSN